MDFVLLVRGGSVGRTGRTRDEGGARVGAAGPPERPGPPGRSGPPGGVPSAIDRGVVVVVVGGKGRKENARRREVRRALPETRARDRGPRGAPACRAARRSPPRPIMNTSRLSTPGDPPHRHTPPSCAHAQWPHRNFAERVSSLPDASSRVGSSSSGWSPAGPEASASSAGSRIPRGLPSARSARGAHECAGSGARADEPANSTTTTRKSVTPQRVHRSEENENRSNREINPRSTVQTKRKGDRTRFVSTREGSTKGARRLGSSGGRHSILDRTGAVGRALRRCVFKNHVCSYLQAVAERTLGCDV